MIKLRGTHAFINLEGIKHTVVMGQINGLRDEDRKEVMRRRAEIDFIESLIESPVEAFEHEGQLFEEAIEKGCSIGVWESMDSDPIPDIPYIKSNIAIKDSYECWRLLGDLKERGWSAEELSKRVKDYAERWMKIEGCHPEQIAAKQEVEARKAKEAAEEKAKRDAKKAAKAAKKARRKAKYG